MYPLLPSLPFLPFLPFPPFLPYRERLFMISALEALARLRDGNRRFVQSQALPRTSAAACAGRFRSKRRNRSRSSWDARIRACRRSSSSIRASAIFSLSASPEHRRAVADWQRRVRGSAVRHAAGRRARTLAVRRHHRDARRAPAARRAATRATFDRSSIASCRRCRVSWPARRGMPTRSCTTRSSPTCGRRSTSCATGRN